MIFVALHKASTIKGMKESTIWFFVVKPFVWSLVYSLGDDLLFFTKHVVETASTQKYKGTFAKLNMDLLASYLSY